MTKITYYHVLKNIYIFWSVHLADFAHAPCYVCVLKNYNNSSREDSVHSYTKFEISYIYEISNFVTALKKYLNNEYRFYSAQFFFTAAGFFCLVLLSFLAFVI